jgi:ligand-binding SRPBCC domain-containing protein/predicted DCC family thiol-disulfide oxidoreductase YuxK
MLHTLDTQIRVPRPREDVFPFFCDAFNLERITPPELRFAILTPKPVEMRTGARIRYRLSLWGVPFQWETLISCWEPPYRFVDEQISGPYRRWVHRHELVETPGGTLVYDHVDYELPLAPFGDLFHPLLRKQLARIFRYRHEVLHTIFDSDDFRRAPLLIDAAPALVPAPVTDRDTDPANAARARPAGENWQVKLLYDGACPFCMAEVRFLARRNDGNSLAMEDIAAPGFDAGRFDLDQESVEGKIHAILPDGSVVTGMEVFRRIYSAVGLGWLMAPTGWPVLRPIFDWGYKWFARHRVRLGNLAGRPACTETRCQTRT